MKVLILGATGQTGQRSVKQALDKYYEVTVLVRDPAKLNLSHEKLTVIKGDVLDADVLTKALEGKDAVLSSLGVGKSLKSSNLFSNAVKTLVPAMDATNVRRVIFISAFGVGETLKQASVIQKIMYRIFLGNIYKDKEQADTLLRNSSLDWTLVYPVLLTNGPHTGKYKAGEVLPMKGMPKVSRADVADFMIHQLTEPTFLKKSVVVMG